MAFNLSRFFMGVVGDDLAVTAGGGGGGGGGAAAVGASGTIAGTIAG